MCRLSSMNSSFQFIFFVLFLSSRLPIHSITDQSWWISVEKNDNIKMLVKAYRIESIGQSITILHSKMYCKEIYWLFNTSTVVYNSEPKTIKYFPRQKKETNPNMFMMSNDFQLCWSHSLHDSSCTTWMSLNGARYQFTLYSQL